MYPCAARRPKEEAPFFHIKNNYLSSDTETYSGNTSVIKL